MRPLSVIASALALIAAPLGAQEAASRDTSTDVLILSHDFTFSGEFVRVVLAAGEVYRAEASAPEFSLSLRLLESGQKPLLSREQSREPDPSGRNIIFIYPYTTGTYQVALAEGGPVVSIRVYRDIRASHRRQRMAASAGWEIGGELAFGGHTRYGLADPDFPSTVGLDDGGRAGIGIEGCLSARQGSGAARILSGCAFGVGWHNRPGGSGVLWLFMEPRLRLVGGRAYGEPNNEVGVLLRGALGAVSRAGYTPRLVAPGLYLAHNTRKNPNRGNWYFMLMYRHGFLSKTGPQSANSSTDMVSAGLGYYK